jgi:hypothetical protein
MSFKLKGKEHHATFNKKTKTLVLDGQVLPLLFINKNASVTTPLGATDKGGVVIMGDDDEIQWKYIGKENGSTDLTKTSAEAACLAIAAATMSPYSLVWAALAFYFDKLDAIYYTTWYYVDPNDYMHALYYTEIYEDKKRKEKIEDWTAEYSDEDLIDWAD